jgi:hypothetical protein
MEAAALRGRILATLDSDADTRRRAELELKTVRLALQTFQGNLLIIFSQAEEHPGFTDALLDILQGEQEEQIRLSSMPPPESYTPLLLH